MSPATRRQIRIARVLGAVVAIGFACVVYVVRTGRSGDVIGSTIATTAGITVAAILYAVRADRGGTSPDDE